MSEESSEFDIDFQKEADKRKRLRRDKYGED